jgi:predicted transcriptional regulator
MSSDGDHRSWTFLTNHTQVLLCLTRDPDMRLREVAEAVGVTERAVQRIVAELVAGGYLERSRVGRRNHYTVNRDHTMRHVAQAGHQIGGLLDLLESAERPLA